MWIHHQLWRGFLSLSFPAAGVTIARLLEIKPYLEFLSLVIGITGGLLMIASLLHHWNDKK